MKKYLFIVPIVLMGQYISAQALTKNGNVVTESTVSTLKVGDVTYPNTDGTYGQVLTTDGVGTASWSSPSTGGLASVFDGTNLILDDSYSGSIIYINDASNYRLFSQYNYLTDGFNCTIINTFADNDYDIITVIGAGAMFFYQIPNGSNQTYFRQYSSNFSIRPGGTVRISVITVNSEKRIYITGDLMENPA